MAEICYDECASKKIWKNLVFINCGTQVLKCHNPLVSPSPRNHWQIVYVISYKKIIGTKSSKEGMMKYAVKMVNFDQTEVFYWSTSGCFFHHALQRTSASKELEHLANLTLTPPLFFLKTVSLKIGWTKETCSEGFETGWKPVLFLLLSWWSLDGIHQSHTNYTF